MSKFNETTKGINKTVNKSGHVAYKMSDKDKLMSRVLTSFFGEEKYYGDTTNDLVKEAIALLNSSPMFVANLAVYARKEMHLRSVSHALAALVANNENSKKYIVKVVDGIVERADDILEILSCYIGMFGKPIPNGLKKALSAAMNKFNEYQFSKYNGGSKSVKFKDVLGLTHAKPKDEKQSEIFKKILDGALEQAERWETVVSDKGNNAESWERLIAENKLGYMAMLKNFRNILNANPSNIEKVYDKLGDKEQVLKSKQLPFRFYSAYRELAKTNTSSKPLSVLEDALEYSVDNIEKLKGKTIVAIDVSGSMSMKISAKSTISACDIACLLGAMASKICDDVILWTFDTNLYAHTVTKRDSILKTAQSMRFNGGGTDISLAIRDMWAKRIEADRLIILSDNEANCQWGYTCQPFADKYRTDINPDLWVHAIDLAGYGTQQFIGTKTNMISGWSEKILEFIGLAEQGFDKQVKIIENYMFV